MPDTVPRAAYRPPPGADDTTDQLRPVPAIRQPARPENPRHARTRRLRAVAPGWGAWAVVLAIVGGLAFGIVATSATVAVVGRHGPATVKHQGDKPAGPPPALLFPRDSAPSWAPTARTRTRVPAPATSPPARHHRRHRASPAPSASRAARPSPAASPTTPAATPPPTPTPTPPPPTATPTPTPTTPAASPPAATATP